MKRKGVETNTLIMLIVGLLVILIVGGSPLITLIGNAIDQLGAGINFRSSDDKIASDSVKALSCAIDVTAYYNSDDHMVPESGIDFSAFESCREEGEIIAPMAVSAVSKGNGMARANNGVRGAIIDAAQALGNKITGRAAGDEIGEGDENAKCFGGSKERCVKCKIGIADNNGVSCSVQAFELPQRIKKDGTIIKSALDYGGAWLGFTGEPYYLAYYETFPEEAAAAWSYDSIDIVWSAVAVGAVMNVGGGLGKAAWAGVKASSIAGAKGFVVTMRTQGIKKAFKDGAESGGALAAFNERLVLEYGGKRALQDVLSAKAATAVMGGEALELAGDNAIKAAIARHIKGDKNTYSTLSEMFISPDGEMYRYARANELDMVQTLVRSKKPVTSKEIDTLASEIKKGDDAELKKIMESTEKKGKLAGELEALRKKNAEKTLLDEGEKKDLEKTVSDFLSREENKNVMQKAGAFILESQALKEYASKTAKAAYATTKNKAGKDGILVRAKNLLKSKALPAQEAEIMNQNLEETSEMVYANMLRKIDNMPELDKGAKERIIDTYIGALDDPEIDKALIKEHMALAERIFPKGEDSYKAIKNAAGITEKSDMDLISADKKKAFMLMALGASAIGMSQHALEKFETTCGSGNLCLHKPSIFSKMKSNQNYNENNIAFKLYADPKNYDGLVMLHFGTILPGSTADMRFNLASPCKTDLNVKANVETDKKISCEFYTSPNEVLLAAESSGRCGSSPNSGELVGKEEDCCKDSNKFFPSKNIEYLRVQKDAPEETAKILNEKTTLRCLKPDTWATYENKDVLKYNSVRQVNLRQNLETKNMDTVSNCERPWGVDWVPTSIFAQVSVTKQKYISVEPDLESMKQYSEKGNFGENYCFENPKNWNSLFENIGCPAASIALSAFAGYVTVLSVGTASAATVPVITATLGGGEAFCGQIFSMESRWPNSQY